MATGNLTEQPANRSRGKQWLPLVAMIAAFVALMQYAKTPSVDPVNCDIDIEAQAAAVVMLSASWCRYCAKARSFFVAKDINYCEYDIEKTNHGAALYGRSRFGAIPVIFVGEETFVGFNPDQVTRALGAKGAVLRDDF
jgi:glutaredoxin